MKLANTKNLLTLVDSADANGDVCFLVRKDEVVRTKDQAREWLSVMFMMTPVLTVKLDVVKKAITEIDLRLAPVENGVLLTLNLPKFLQLPGVAPAEELAAYRGMLALMREFFESHPTKSCNVQVCNNRDSNGRVYGTVNCRVPSPTEANKAESDEAATEALTAYIAARPALTHWLRTTALNLQRRGPWAWTLIREDDIFGFCQGPFSAHIQREMRDNPPPPGAAITVIPLDIRPVRPSKQGLDFK